MRQLTNYKGHSHHLYFTNPGWFDGGRRLLFGSDRMGRTNLFSLDLESGQITQHTDSDHKSSYQVACLNPLRDEAYYWRDSQLFALDLHDNRERPLYRLGDGLKPNIVNVTSDGQTVCTAFCEDLSGRFRVDLLHGYVGFREYWQAMPQSTILTVPVDGGRAREVFSERYWVGHINSSPTQPNLLSFCHEGPWENVDQRIWGLDLNTGKTWPIRQRQVADERIGHEYWLADGVQIGYHGSRPDGSKIIGRIRFDDTDCHDSLFPWYTQHIHSNTPEVIVGDGAQGGRFIRLFRWNGNGYESPRILCEHGTSAFHQLVHAHPRFSPDGTKVIFTSDRTGYAQIYEAQVPDIASLPHLELPAEAKP
jgi:oligogalacturonide lyase